RDGDGDRDRLAQRRIERNRRRLAAVEEDMDRAAVITLPIKGKVDRLVVAAGKRQQALDARGRLVLAGKQSGSVADGPIERAGRATGREGDLIGLGIGDERCLVGLLLPVENLQAEEVERLR